MTKFEAYVEKLRERRETRKNEEFNMQLAISLATRTKEEVIEDMLGELTFIVGTANVLAESATATGRELLVF